MDYFAGLDISMNETHVCVVDREGMVVHEGKSGSSTIPKPFDRPRRASARPMRFSPFCWRAPRRQA